MDNADKPLPLSDYLPAGMTGDEILVILSGIAAFIAVFAIGNSFLERDNVRARIDALKKRMQERKSEALAQGKRRKHKETHATRDFMRNASQRFDLMKHLQPQHLEKWMVQAGYHSKDAPRVFAFCVFASLIIGACLAVVVLLLPFWEGKIYVKGRFVCAVALLYLGYKLPYLVVGRRRKKRYLHLQRALPDTLDLMTICAEAGLSLAASLDRVARELGLAYPVMAEEITITTTEIGFLPDREKALSNLAERASLPEIRGIVNVLLQTEKYGTPIAQALRVLSAEFRQQRMLRAENKAARLPALMTVPMILFILPTLFIVVIAPAAVRLMMREG